MSNSKVGLYIRVSTDAQFEEGYSVEAQKEKLEQYCKLKDFKDYEFYIDGGWSGSNIKRPEMQRMIENIKQNKISSVIVYKLDRLSRSQKDTIFLLEDVFIPNNCDFISLNENFDTSTPYGKAMIGILSVFAQLERENIRERTRMGMYERVKSGLWMGGGKVPFGYNYDQNKNILIPNEHAKDVKKIYDLYLQGYSTTQLAQMFDVANDKHITAILDRETYLGKINFKGETLQGQHEAIIDEVTWKKVQIERKKRSTKNVVSSSHLLTGLIYCGKCGARMRYQQWGKDKMKIYCYSQQTSKKNLIKDPDCNNLKADAFEVEDIVINHFLSRIDEDYITDDFQNAKESAYEILIQKYNIISTKLKRLYNLYAESEDDLLLETIQENKLELDKLTKSIESEQKIQEITQEISKTYETIDKIKTSWNTMTIKQKQQALKLCINRIEVTDDVVDIIYNF